MDRPNRRISNRYLRLVMMGIGEEMGSASLQRMLRQAGMNRYIGRMPPVDGRTEAFASELAAMQQVIRSYYGQGARGSLNRIGRAVWRQFVQEAPPLKKLRLFLYRFFPEPTRSMRILGALLAVIRTPDGEITLHQADTDLILVDRASDFTHGQVEDEPMCWVTLGMIQEALSWASGQEPDVEEIACRATGAKACQFMIRLPAAPR